MAGDDTARRLGKKPCLSGLLFLLVPSIALAETALGTIVVTPSKQEELLENTAASATVIDRKEIESQGATTVPEVLRKAAGIDLVSIGSPGDDQDIRLRGADRDQVLVLINGVPINSVREHRSLFLGNLPLDAVERIEVVRGSQSVLYGSDAVGGVINIITRQGTGPTKYSLRFEGGNLGTFREGAGLLGGTAKARYRLDLSRTDWAGRFDNDRFGEYAASTDLGFAFSPRLGAEIGGTYFRSDQELFYQFARSFDPGTGSLLVQIDPDNNNHLHRDFFSGRLKLKAQPFDSWNIQFLYGLLVDRDLATNLSIGDTVPAGFTAISGDQNFSGLGLQQTMDLRNFVALYESPSFKTDLTLGVELQLEKLGFNDPINALTFPAAGQKGTRENLAPYLQQTLSLLDESLILTGGVRFDHNTTFGNEWSPRASVLYKLRKTGTTFRGSYGEGFHGPTLKDYYDQVLLQATGDPGFQPIRLQAELTRSYEAGIEQKLGRYGDLSLTFFYTDYDRLLDELQFIQDAYTTGLEASFSLQPVASWEERFQVGGYYTFLKGQNKSNGVRLSNRPEHQGGVFAAISPVSPLQIRTDLKIVGSRLIPNAITTAAGDLPVVFIDKNGTPSTGTLAGYVKLDLSAQYRLFHNRRHLEEWKLFGKIENLLDDTYQEKFGFPSPGITFLAGTQATF